MFVRLVDATYLVYYNERVLVFAFTLEAQDLTTSENDKQSSISHIIAVVTQFIIYLDLNYRSVGVSVDLSLLVVVITQEADHMFTVYFFHIEDLSDAVLDQWRVSEHALRSQFFFKTK